MVCQNWLICVFWRMCILGINFTWAWCMILLMCCCPVLKSCASLWSPYTAACHTPLSFGIFQSLLKFMSVESMMLSNHVICYHPLLLLPSFFPSIRDFSSESAVHIRWPKYWCFSFSIRLSNEYSGLVSFRIDWIDLAHQRTLKSLLQHHSLKASIFQYSAFFTVELSHLYVTISSN